MSIVCSVSFWQIHETPLNEISTSGFRVSDRCVTLSGYSSLWKTRTSQVSSWSGFTSLLMCPLQI